MSFMTVTLVTAIFLKKVYTEGAMKDVNYKNILIPYDGSKLAAAAIPHAITLAQACKAQVILLHVVNSVEQELINLTLPTMRTPVMPMKDSIEESVKANKKKAKLQLDRIKKAFEEHGIKKVATYVEEGSVLKVVLHVAKTERCDLIIMSTHGRSGLKRFMLGSVAEHIVRHVTCPVLLIRPEK